MKKKKLSEITVNNTDVFLCERIVAFGDSMIEGAELLDHNLPIGHLKKKMNAYDWSKLIWEKDLVAQHLRNKEEIRKLSYPAQLALLLKKNFVNHGVGGNSLESICWQLFNFYTPEPTDLILIGLPPVERLWKFIGPEVFDGNVHLGWKDTYKEYQDSLVDWYSEPRLLWEYIKCLSMIRDYKKAVHPNLYVMPQWQSLDNLTKNLPAEWKGPLSAAISKFFRSDLFLFQHPLYSMPWMTKLEHGHPTLPAHIRMAKHLNTHHIKSL